MLGIPDLTRSELAAAASWPSASSCLGLCARAGSGAGRGIGAPAQRAVRGCDLGSGTHAASSRRRRHPAAIRATIEHLTTSCRRRRRSRTSSTTIRCTASSTCRSRALGGARQSPAPRLPARGALPRTLRRRAGSAGDLEAVLREDADVSTPTRRSAPCGRGHAAAGGAISPPCCIRSSPSRLPAELADRGAGRPRALPAGRRGGDRTRGCCGPRRTACTASARRWRICGRPRSPRSASSTSCSTRRT